MIAQHEGWYESKGGWGVNRMIYAEFEHCTNITKPDEYLRIYDWTHMVVAPLMETR